MLQGDELAVQLFIGAAAINALSVAMTQAGWTHKWFVRGMFALTFILAGLFLMLVAGVACVVPARRATRVEPVEALRAE